MGIARIMGFSDHGGGLRMNCRIAEKCLSLGFIVYFSLTMGKPLTFSVSVIPLLKKEMNQVFCMVRSTILAPTF